MKKTSCPRAFVSIKIIMGNYGLVFWSGLDYKCTTLGVFLKKAGTKLAMTDRVNFKFNTDIRNKK